MSSCPEFKTYFVVSPEIELYPGDSLFPEPPEYGNAVMEVEARNKQEAMSKAIRNPNREMEKWIKVARGDNHTPFAGLAANHPHCEHDTCIDSAPDQDPVQVCGGCKREELAYNLGEQSTFTNIDKLIEQRSHGEGY